jgi:hypothetical protein
MSSEELDALLAEMEPEVRAADRDLREIDLLDKRGVLGAGNLAGARALVLVNVRFRLMSAIDS